MYTVKNITVGYSSFTVFIDPVQSIYTNSDLTQISDLTKKSFGLELCVLTQISDLTQKALA